MSGRPRAGEATQANAADVFDAGSRPGGEASGCPEADVVDAIRELAAVAGLTPVALTPRGRVLVTESRADAWRNLPALCAAVQRIWPGSEVLPAGTAAAAPRGSDLAAAAPYPDPGLAPREDASGQAGALPAGVAT